MKRNQSGSNFKIIFALVYLVKAKKAVQNVREGNWGNWKALGRQNSPDVPEVERSYFRGAQKTPWCYLVTLHFSFTKSPMFML